MLKKKWLDRREVKSSILNQDFAFIERNDEKFNGYIGYLKLNKVAKTKIVNINGLDRCVLKDGHAWLQWIERDKNYVVVAIFDEKNNLIEWYVDIILSQSLDSGMPCYDDIYLDVVAFPIDKTVIFMDEDELLEALDNEIINKEEYDLAYEVGNYLFDRYKNHMDEEIKHTYEMLEYFNENNK